MPGRHSFNFTHAELLECSEIREPRHRQAMNLSKVTGQSRAPQCSHYQSMTLGKGLNCSELPLQSVSNVFLQGRGKSRWRVRWERQRERPGCPWGYGEDTARPKAGRSGHPWAPDTALSRVPPFPRISTLLSYQPPLCLLRHVPRTQRRGKIISKYLLN